MVRKDKECGKTVSASNLTKLCVGAGEERGGVDDRKQGPWRADPVPVLRNQLDRFC